MNNFVSDLVSKVFTVHNGYSTLVGSTQPIFDRIAHSIQNISSFILHSKPLEMATKAIVGTISQSRMIQGGLQKTVTLLTSNHPLSFPVKIHLLNQDPKIKRLKAKINDLENKIEASYYKVFQKPILMEKIGFSKEEYQAITSHFQKFLSENENDQIEHMDSFLTTSIESLIDFIEDDIMPDSQLIKEEVIDIIENLSPQFTVSNDSSENETIVEAKQGFQNCYFLFLCKELLQKFEKGEVYKDDLVVFLKNYKIPPITSLLNDATIENIGEVCAGMIGEVITESSLAEAFHKAVDKKILGPILSISPLHWLLGNFSSYLGITLASYIGIKALGSNESLKDYVHNMTWATIASMITEYGLEISEISNPGCTFLLPLIASSIAYNFSSFYGPLLKTEYLAQTVSENYSSFNESTDKLLENICIQPIRQEIHNMSDLELKNHIEKTIIRGIDFSIDQIPECIPLTYQDRNCLFNFIKTNLDIFFSENSDPKLKNLILQMLDLKEVKAVSKELLIRGFSVLFKQFSNFYFNLMKDKNILKDFYARREGIIQLCSNLRGNNDVNSMLDIQDILLELVYTINPLHKNSSEIPLLFAQVDKLLPTSLFQSLSKTLENSLQSIIHPFSFSIIDPLFLEIVVKSFLINKLLEKQDLFIEATFHKEAFFLQNILRVIDSLIHISLIGQYNSKQEPLIGNIFYNLAHKEMNAAIQSIPQAIKQYA